MSRHSSALCANEPELATLRTVDPGLPGRRPRTVRLAARRRLPGLSRWDADFSARLGDAGFVGLTIPDRVRRARAWPSAPLSWSPRNCWSPAHRWPRTGSPTVRSRPACWPTATRSSGIGSCRASPRARFYSAIGMSEPQAGSDLAAASTRATSRPTAAGCSTARKVWTSGAHLAHQIVVLARTSPLDPEHRHAGFSQFIVPTDAPGVTIEPDRADGRRTPLQRDHLRRRLRPDADVLGEIGDGWHQVTAELSFERSGPERILSTAPLILGLIGALGRSAETRRRRPDRRRRRRPGGPADLAAPAVGLGGARVGRGVTPPTRPRWSRISAPASSRTRSNWSPI